MPIPHSDIEALTHTFEKNSTDLMNAIMYGALFYKMKTANDNADGMFPEYEDQQQLELGLSEDLNYKMAEDLAAQTAEAYVTKDRPYDSFMDVIYGIEKSNNRVLLEQDAMYRQIYASLPEDEPNREEKAMYLFDASGLRDNASIGYLQDVELKAIARLQRTFDGIVKNKYGGKWKDITIGEVLDEFGLDEAQKQAFIKKHKGEQKGEPGYTSLNETLYENTLRRHPELEGKSEKEIYNEISPHLASCFSNDAKRYMKDVVRKEMPADEAEALDSYQKKVPKINDISSNKEIREWVKEKGQKLADDLAKVHTAATAQNGRLVLESGQTLDHLNADAPLKECLARQTEETTYVGQIIKGEKSVPEVLDGFIKKGREQLPNIENKTAKEFIDEVKEELKADPEGIETDDDRPYKQFATILAARILANSKRGSKASLNETFSRHELNEMTRKLMKNDDFNHFISDTYLDENDENYTKAKNTEHKLCSSRTHGGFIEDEFKKYLLKKNPGELENSPELARYMPTAKERIEELKRQVRNSQDKNIQASAAAEIIAIRNACKVERKTGYGLDRQIPPAPEGERIQEQVQKLTGGHQLREILQDDATRRTLLSRNSHGGQMMINVRKQYEEQVEADDRNPETESLLKKNTVGNRLTELREEANKIITSGQLDSAIPGTRNSAMKKSKEILGEYMAMVGKAIKPQGIEADAPWNSAGQLAQNTVKDPVAGKIMQSPEKASGMLEAIASGSIRTFQSKLKEEMDAVNAPEQKQVQERAQEKEQEKVREEPEGPAVQ